MSVDGNIYDIKERGTFQMKKMLAILMALLMALSWVGAVAEETASGFQLPAVTVTEELHYDADAFAALLPLFGVSEEQMPTMQAILPILGNLTEKLVLADNGLQFDLGLKGETVLTLAGEQTEDGFAFASDLIPSYVITLSNETIQQLMEQFTSQANEVLAGVDTQKLVESLTGYFTEYITVCMGAATMGEPELGEYAFEVGTFNCKTPVTIDTEAIKAGAEKLIAQLKADEGIASLIATAQANGVEVNLNEEVNIVTLEIQCAAYTRVDEEGNQADDVVYVVTETVTKAKEETVNVNVYALTGNGQVEVTVDMPDQNVTVVVLAQPTESGVQANVSVNAQGMYIGCKVEVTMGEAVQINADLYFMDPEKAIASDKTVIAFGGERDFTVLDENKTVISVEDLMQDEEGQYKQALLMDVLGNGLNNLLGKAAEVMPEEVTGLVNMLMGAGEAAIAE